MGDERTEVQHVNAVGNVHDQIHVVLNEQDGHVEFVADLADELGELQRLLRVHTGSGLVEEQELGVGGQGAGDLQLSLLTVGKIAGKIVAVFLQPEDAEQLLGLFHIVLVIVDEALVKILAESGIDAAANEAAVAVKGQIEDLLLNFADRSGVVDVANFANVFATCYKKGGNIKDVIKNTATIIGDKIEIQMELQTMVAGQKNEMNIMLVMPILFIVVMKSMGGGLIDLSSPVGILSTAAALVIFIVAYFAAQKITDIKL